MFDSLLIDVQSRGNDNGKAKSISKKGEINNNVSRREDKGDWYSGLFIRIEKDQ